MTLSLVVVVPGKAYQLICTDDTNRRWFLGVFAITELQQIQINGLRVETEA